MHILCSWNFWGKFYKLYLDQDDVVDALREVKMSPKMKKKGRPREAETTVIGLPQTKKLHLWKSSW